MTRAHSPKFYFGVSEHNQKNSLIDDDSQLAARRFNPIGAMENLIKILIVDDEPEARELIQYMLKGEENVSVSGMAGDVDEAIRLMQQEKADLVLLGMVATGGEEARRYLDGIFPLLDRLPTTLLIWSNGEADVFA